MTLSAEVLASLADCPLDWELLPLNGSKQVVDPETGRLLANWAACGTDVEGITAIAGSAHVKAVGLLLGPQSGGVLAVDFDGKACISKFAAVFGHHPQDLPATISVTSGRPMRGCQFFNVDRDAWPLLKRRVAWSDADKATCLELRWERHYQVIAGAHPSTDGYRWVTPPSEIALPATAPEWLVKPLVRQECQAEPYVPANGDAERALAMLACLPPADFQCYDRWLEVGMTLHSVDPGLLSAWVDWSRGMDAFNEGECLLKWESFKGGGVTIATLHHHAKAYGYKPSSQGGGGTDVGKLPAAEGGGDHVGKLDDWIVKDFLARGSSLILAASKGVGKSSLLYRLCHAVEQGSLFMGQLPTKKARCLILQADEPEAHAKRKLLRMEITNPLFQIRYLEKGRYYDMLMSEITSGNWDMIAADSISTLLSTKDNKFVDIGFEDGIYRLTKACGDNGVALLLTHHLGKTEDKQQRREVTDYDFIGVSTILNACGDCWSMCKIPEPPRGRPLWPHHVDLRCHGKRFCEEGTVWNLAGDPEDYYWELRSTGDGLLPQEAMRLEERIFEHFTVDPTPLTLVQLSQRLTSSLEHTRRVVLPLSDQRRLLRTRAQSKGPGRPPFLYRLAS